jgi:pyoverdine/dityrosine biosynthesis protein Dit1
MGSYVAGLACKSQGPPSLFDLFFSRLILTQMSLGTQHAATINETLVEPITDLFDRFLRYEAAKDEWLLQGRRCFASKIRFFTSRNVRLEFCLPAFPCKSSNPDKVTGTIPDRGEEMALRRLHKFVAEMEEIYQPGARVWVISDGHVFSDCSEQLSST